jgi:hypothetical protein
MLGPAQPLPRSDGEIGLNCLAHVHNVGVDPAVGAGGQTLQAWAEAAVFRGIVPRFRRRVRGCRATVEARAHDAERMAVAARLLTDHRNGVGAERVGEPEGVADLVGDKIK